MVWNEERGSVTRAFDDWKGTDSEIRAFMSLSLRWIQSGYDTTWELARQEFERDFDPDRDDPDGFLDVFDRKVSGLSAKDYFWMLRSGALRDGVTAFEVYAEKSIEELLSWFSFTHSDGASYRLHPVVARSQVSPGWATLRDIHAALGNDLETDEIKYLRGLRHLLTHQRGELRTEEQRLRFLSESDPDDWLVGDAYVGGTVPIAHQRVVEMMDQIASVVRSADHLVWTHTWGGAGFPEALRSLATGRNAPLRWRSLA